MAIITNIPRIFIIAPKWSLIKMSILPIPDTCRAHFFYSTARWINICNEESGAIHYVSIFSCKGLDFPVM